VAEILQLDEGTIRRHVRRGSIPYFKIGMTIRFDPSDLAEWLEAKSMISFKEIKLAKGSKPARRGFAADAPIA